jgi:putative lipoprotein
MILGSVLILTFIFGCKTAQTAVDESSFLNVHWQLDSCSVLEEKALELRMNITMFYNQGEKGVSGFSGCNRFVGAVEWNKKSMAFGEMAATEMFCDGRMEWEKTFVEMLKSVDSYSVDEDKLVLLKGKTVLATFSKQIKNIDQ